MTTSATKTPTWFWVLSILALIWNLLGIMGFFANVNLSSEALAQYSEAEQEIYRTTPIWVNIAFGTAVFAGAIGSLGLVLRKKWAKPMLIISLIGVIVQMFHAFFIVNGIEVYGIERMIMPMVVILVSVLLVWLANSVQPKVWYN